MDPGYLAHFPAGEDDHLAPTLWETSEGSTTIKGMSGRFLMMTTRTIEEVAESEREALLRFTGLSEDELVNVRLEREPFPQIDFKHWDGIILCGSSYDVSAREDDKSRRQREIEWNLQELTERAMTYDFPLLGICYGLGITAKYLGGTVGPQISEDISAPALQLTAEGRRDPILEGVPERFNAYVGHHESVIEAPPQMIPLVTGAGAPLQMARVGRSIYLTQFHPELDFVGINVRIESFADYGYYPPEERAIVEARVAGVDVSHAHKILANFVSRFSTDQPAA